MIGLFATIEGAARDDGRALALGAAGLLAMLALWGKRRQIGTPARPDEPEQIREELVGQILHLAGIPQSHYAVYRGRLMKFDTLSLRRILRQMERKIP